ncbi:MAG: Stp1/IreP family PP2C-type Ser/Thr phosphatase [Candidatus Zixiibacteriota bacterium]
MVNVTMHGDSDIGRVRRINEDNFRLIPSCPAVVVCDGMGGHAAGEIASQRAVETIEAYLLGGSSIAPPPPGLLPAGLDSLSVEALELVWAVRLANRRVFQTAQTQRQMRGMGTTLVATRFVPGYAIICHVGDSRAYRFRGGRLEPLTVDHSLVAELVAQNEITPEQARTFADRNIITRALGTRPVVAVDVNVVPLRPGDWYVLCSDGLSGTIRDEEIAAILSRQGQSAARAVGELIAAANAAGGPDNITVAIAEIDDVDEPVEGRQKTETVPEPSDTVADQESGALDALFPGVKGSATVPEAQTDRIRIDPSLL